MVLRTGCLAAFLMCMATVTALAQSDVLPNPLVLKAQPEPGVAPVALPRADDAPESLTDQPFVDLSIRLLELRGKVKLPAEKATPATSLAAEPSPKNNEPKASPLSPGTGGQSRVLSKDEVAAFITTLQADPRANILSAPRMRMQLGTKGELRSGGEVVVGNEGVGINKNGEPSSTLKTLFFGTALDATVTNPKPGLLRVVLNLEHSTPNTPVAGIPSVNTRRIATTVELKNGQTVMLRGLKSTRHAASITRVPVLGEIPVIGDALFSKTKVDTEETELVVLITPELVDAVEK